jgi:hypothetical protein
MRPRKNGRILLCAAALLACRGQPADAVTRTFTAKVRYATTAVVGKSPEPAPAPSPALPVPPDPAIFMDSYGFTWAEYGGIRQAGAVTIAGSRSQFMNFLADNLQPDNALEMLKIICSMNAAPGESCSRLLAPDGKSKTIYLGMNVLVKNHAGRANGAAATADAAPSFDITVVYQ